MSNLPFADSERNDARPARHGESLFHFLDRVDTPYWAQVRSCINQWSAEFCPNERDEITRRLRSDDDRAWFAAYWEVYLHALFSRLGYHLSCHPPIAGTSRSPDFHIEGNGADFYLEATLAGGDDDVGEDRRRARIYDLINDRVHSPDFFLWLDLVQQGASDPPASPLIAGVHAWLDSLLWQQVRDQFDRSGNGLLDLEPWTWVYDDWQIDFRPIPKSDEARGNPNLRPLGTSGGGARFVDDASPLRRSIRKKASRYGDLDKPFLVAVQHMAMGVDDIDVTNALFGSEVVQITGPDPEHFQMARAADGAWNGPTGLQHRRVSAVLIARNLAPWTAGGCHLSVWHHPNPKFHLALTPGPWGALSVNASGGIDEIAAETAPHDALGLPDPWPEGPVGFT